MSLTFNDATTSSVGVTYIVLLVAHGVVAAGAEGVETADEGGILADDGVPLVAEDLGGQLDALVTARDDDGGIVEAVALGNRLTDAPDGLLPLGHGAAERLVAVGSAVLEGGGGIVCKNISGKASEIRHGEGLGGGVACGQGDGVGILGGFQNFTDRGGLEAGDLIGKLIGHNGISFRGWGIYNSIL